MKPCPSCESTEGYRYQPDDDGNDPLLTFEPPQSGQKEDGPGYVAVEHFPETSVDWDFTTYIECMECSEPVRAGDVLEPEPVERQAFEDKIRMAKVYLDFAEENPLGYDHVERIEEAIRLLVTAKNMAARGVK
jgi:hypothetical protein